MLLRNVFVSNRKETTGDSIKLHNEELNDLLLLVIYC